MRKIYLLLVLSLTILWLVNTSFQEAQPLTKAQIVQREIDIKTADFRAKEREKCRKKVLEEATETVDSTMIARALLERVDTIQRPPKPIKPNRPEMKKPQDDSPVRPLINQ